MMRVRRALLCLLLILPAPALAQTPEQARAQVMRLVDAVDGAARLPGGAAKRRGALLVLLPAMLDMTAIATFLAGPAPSPRPQSRERKLADFAAVLPVFLARDLRFDPARLRGFSHEIDRVAAVAGGYDVYAHAILPRDIGAGLGGQRMNLTWRVQKERARNGGMRIADLRIEGVSLLQLLRPVLGMRIGLGRDGLAAVVTRMRKAAACRPADRACGG